MPAAAVRVSLGCGNPIAVADLRDGDTVLDLGSGGGLDVLLSARRVGPTGFVYGLDATDEMVELARRNATEAGVDNVEFLHGTIDHVPLDGRLGRCRHLQLRHRPRHRQGRRVRRDRPRPATRWPRSGSATSSATATIDGTAAGCRLRERRHHHRRLRRQTAPRRPHRRLHPAHRSARRRPAQRHHPRHQTRRRRAGNGTGDWPAVRTIYEAGIASGDATFETTTPSWEDWDRSHLADHRLVATDADGQVVGWAALSPVSDRCAYAGVAENSVYVHPEHQRRGIGSILLHALITRSEDAGYWTIQTGIFPDNIASLTVHQRAGFRIVGRRERIGQLDGVWRDTILLERRSRRL